MTEINNSAEVGPAAHWPDAAGASADAFGTLASELEKTLGSLRTMAQMTPKNSPMLPLIMMFGQFMDSLYRSLQTAADSSSDANSDANPDTASNERERSGTNPQTPQARPSSASLPSSDSGTSPQVQTGTIGEVWFRDHNNANNFTGSGSNRGSIWAGDGNAIGSWWTPSGRDSDNSWFSPFNNNDGSWFSPFDLPNGGGGEGGGEDPLVFDLNGNGINLLASDDNRGTEIRDLAATGLADRQQYSKLDIDDGLLVFDLDKDGRYGEHGGEMFGNRSGYGGELHNNDADGTPHLQVLDPETGAVIRHEQSLQQDTYANGFEALKAIAEQVLGAEAVADGSLGADDIAALEQRIGLRLKVNNEDLKLSELGIFEINLNYHDSIDQQLSDGSTITEQSAFKRHI